MICPGMRQELRCEGCSAMGRAVSPTGRAQCPPQAEFGVTHAQSLVSLMGKVQCPPQAELCLPWAEFSAPHGQSLVSPTGCQGL